MGKINKMTPTIFLEPNIETLMTVSPNSGPQCFCYPVDFLDLSGKKGTFLKTMIYSALGDMIAEKGINNTLDSLTMI